MRKLLCFVFNIQWEVISTYWGSLWLDRMFFLKGHPFKLWHTFKDVSGHRMWGYNSMKGSTLCPTPDLCLYIWACRIVCVCVFTLMAKMKMLEEKCCVHLYSQGGLPPDTTEFCDRGYLHFSSEQMMDVWLAWLKPLFQFMWLMVLSWLPHNRVHLGLQEMIVLLSWMWFTLLC
jgi:hypothetical protein